MLYFGTAQTVCAPSCFRWKFLKWTPLTVHLMFTSFCIYYLPQSIHKYASKVDWLSHIFLSTAVLPSIFIIISNIISNYNIQNILYMIFDLETIIDKQFGKVQSYTQIKRRHNWKIFILLSIFVWNVICRLAFPSEYVKKTTGAAILITQFFNDMFVLYFVFHIDLLHYIIKFLNTNLEQISKPNRLNENQCEEIMMNVTLIHRKIWTIKSVIENRFVWTLMIVFFKSFIATMINVYWFFRLLVLQDGFSFAISRKYMLYFIFI